MKNHCRYKLGLNKPKVFNRTYTQEQIKWLEENYPKLGCRKCVDAFNKKFNEHRTISSMKNFGMNYNVKVDDHVATQNKLEYGARRAGSKRELRKVGDVREECGRLVMKTEDGWDQVGRVIWKKHHGEIPEGYTVIHLDNNVRNYDISNLACIPIKYLGYLCRYNLKSEFDVVTQTGIEWCRLYDLIKDECTDVSF